MEKMLIVSTGKYPNGNAGAIRQHSFAKLYRLCGYETFVIGLGESTDFKNSEYDDVKYTSFRAPKNTAINRFFNLFLYKSRLKKFLKINPRFSKIMVVSVPFNALLYLKKYANEKGIQLIHDSVEWYSKEEFSLGIFSPSYAINNAYNTKWIDSNFKVIAISKYLQNHYIFRGIDTIKIPVIMDINSMSHKKRTNPDKLVLVYAGSVGKKDYLKEIIEGLSLLEVNELNKVELRIFGVTSSQLINNISVSEDIMLKTSSVVKCFGRVEREVVLNNLEESNFTVLLRSPTQRYAKAGFPTKVVESLASSTPVILNITSDLADYLKDMINSIYVSECSAEHFCIALRKALQINKSDEQVMQYNSRITAEKYFDYHNYIDDIKF